MDINQLADSDLKSCVRLWESVLERSLEDMELLIKQRHSPVRKRHEWIYRQDLRSLRRWFLSQSEEVGAFLWICDTADLNHRFILSKIKGRLATAREILNGI